MGTGANRHQDKWTFGEKGIPNALKRYPSALCPFSPNIYKWALGQMGTETNGHLGQMDIWGKGVPQVTYRGTPSALCPFLKNVCKQALGQMGIWGKRTFGEKGYPKCPEGVPSSAMCPFSPNVYKWAPRQMDNRGKGIPQVPYRSTPSDLCSFSKNVCKWALGEMGTYSKCIFGGTRYPKCPKRIPSSPFLPDAYK